MKENKKETEANSEEQTRQKAFWIVGIAIIIFLIFLLGSIIGLRFTRDGINSFLDKFNGIDNVPSKQNYIVLEDGTKENKSEEIKKAEIIVEGVKFYKFAIRDREGLSTVEVVTENIAEDVLSKATFKVEMYDSNNELIADYRIISEALEPKIPTLVVTNVMEDCSNASRIEVKMVSENQVSGEQ